MASTITLVQFLLNCKSRMNEAGNTSVADTPSGTNTTPDKATNARLQEIADWARVVLCRSAFPLFGNFQQTSLPIGTKTVRLQDLAPNTSAVPQTPSGAELWRPMPNGVYYNNVQLYYVTQQDLAAWDEDFLNVVSGTPDSWYPMGAGMIGIYVPPSAAQTLSVHGLYIPPVAAGSGAMYPYFPDDLVTRFIEPFTCAYVSAKNADDSSMAIRAQSFMEEANETLSELWLNLDSTLRNWAYPSVPKEVLPEKGNKG